MRVIAGKFKGKKLTEFDNKGTRPTLDRVKESIFNVINFSIEGKVMVDLFAGTGALGIEALSRGASKVYFVDSNKKAVDVIKTNLKSLNIEANVFSGDYLQFLKKLDTRVDIFLLDPPFKTDFALQAIDYIKKNELLSDDGIIVWERAFDDNAVEFDYDIKIKKYGTVQVVFLYNKKGNQ